MYMVNCKCAANGRLWVKIENDKSIGLMLGIAWIK